MKQNFVEFLSPGSFFAEATTKAIDSWDVEQAKAMAREIKERHGATPYGFRFVTRERKDDELDSKIVQTGNMFYLGGVIETVEQVEARDPKSILASNMRSNGWGRVVTNNNSWRWTQPLNDDDVVLEWAQ